MQPRFTVGILVLHAEGLVCAIRYSSFFFQTTPAGVVAEPQLITIFINYLSWNTDLVTVEVVGLLVPFDFGIGVIVYLCQGFVGIRVGVEIGIPAVELGDQLVMPKSGEVIL